MNYNEFVTQNKNLLNELSNRLILSPTEQTLKECAAAIFIKVVDKYPNMNLDLVTEYSWNIVERYLLPMTQNKQYEILNHINPGMENELRSNNSNITNSDFKISIGTAWGLGIALFSICCIFGATEAFSDGTISMICLIGGIILWIIPKKK